MKVSIIGGAGRVGSNAAFALQLFGDVKEIALIDVAADVAAGEALDLLHGSAGTYPVSFTSGSYEQTTGSDVVIITAGLRRKPDESRLDLINRNVALFRNIIGELKMRPWPKDVIFFVVANPVDILTYIAAQELSLPSSQVIGLGTMLDTLRFRSLIADELGLDHTQVDALMLGEHGDSMVPIWSKAAVNGVSLRSLAGFDAEKQAAIEARTRKSGAEVISLKGGAGYAVGVAIAQVVRAIARDAGTVLPISTVQTGALGITDLAFSLPTRLGLKGVLEILEPELEQEELAGLEKSAAVLRQTLDSIA